MWLPPHFVKPHAFEEKMFQKDLTLPPCYCPQPHLAIPRIYGKHSFEHCLFTYLKGREKQSNLLSFGSFSQGLQWLLLGQMEAVAWEFTPGFLVVGRAPATGAAQDPHQQGSGFFHLFFSRLLKYTSYIFLQPPWALGLAYNS